MSVTESAPRVARRHVAARATQIQRAVAAIELVVDEMPMRDQLVALNYVLGTKVREARETDVLAHEHAS